jgi:DNA-binding Xre family transcriptional regulator
VTVDYEWRLRLLMAEHGMFKASDLQPRLAEHGIELSASQVWRLVTGRPERLNLRVLVVLCEILDCEPGELVRRTSVAAPVVKEPASGRAISKDLRPKRCSSSGPPTGRERPASDRRLRALRPDRPGQARHRDASGAVPQLSGLRAQAQDALPRLRRGHGQARSARPRR